MIVDMMGYAALVVLALAALGFLVSLPWTSLALIVVGYVSAATAALVVRRLGSARGKRRISKPFRR